MRTVSVAKTAVAHSLPGERSSVAASRLKRPVSLLRGWAGKCSRSPSVASTRDWLVTRIVEYGPCATAMGVEAVRDERVRPWSHARELGCPSTPGKGYGIAAGEKKGGKRSRQMKPRVSPI